MSEYADFQAAEWLKEGIKAAKAGERHTAQQLLMRVVEANERSEQGWLWLSGVVDTDEDRLICLENVLALNPDNVQARAGLRWLHERGVSAQTLGAEGAADASEVTPYAEIETHPEPSVAAPDSVSFMLFDGCVYCGLPVNDAISRCSHCGGRLATKQFKKAERPPVGYVLHVEWIILAGVDLAGFFAIGYFWSEFDQLPALVKGYLPYIVGPVVTGEATMGTIVEPQISVQVVRLVLLGLAVLSVLVAAGLFVRRPMAHMLGLALITVHLAVALALFALGFLGYLLAAIWGLLIVMITTFMFNTIDDFGKEERRERLEPDRRLINDVDYYSRGRIHEKRGMWAKALLHWQRAAAMNPTRDTYFAAMARAYAHLGRFDDALKQMDTALQVSRTPEVWHSLRDVIVAAQRNGVRPRAGLKGPPTPG